jgi:hypothetical protein
MYKFDLAGFDYNKVPTMVMNAIQLYRNSIGDIATPGYDYWSNNIDAIEKAAKTDTPALYGTGRSYIMICIIWSIWFLNQYLVLIILLNFLIAIISQSYDSVMSTSLQTKYTQRCDLNWECTLL